MFLCYEVLLKISKALQPVP